MKWMMGLLVSSVLISQSWAGVISVNLDTVPSSTIAIGPTEFAGVVVATNWNNVTSSDGTFNFGANYYDDSNNLTTLAVASTKLGSDSFNTGGSADQRIYGDFLNAGSGVTLSLSNVPYAVYDLIIYQSHYDGGEVNIFTIGTESRTLTNTQFPWDFPTGGHIENDTYVRFDGLTSADVDVVVTRTSGNIGIAGFQISQVPEPATIGLLGMAAIGILARRRAMKA